MTRRQILWGLPFLPFLALLGAREKGIKPTDELAVRGPDGVAHRVMVEQATWNEPRYEHWANLGTPQLAGSFLTKGV
mgnify:CR=1 FL=1